MRRAKRSGSRRPPRQLEWRREALRATLWLVPTILIVVAACPLWPEQLDRSVGVRR